MYNQKIAAYLQEMESCLSHIIDSTKPNHEILSGMSLYMELTKLQDLFYKLNSNLFLAAPPQLEEEIIKAKKIQNNHILTPDWKEDFLRKPKTTRNKKSKLLK